MGLFFDYLLRRRLLRELGARFERLGRDEYAYVDGERRFPIYAEMGTDPDLVVYRADIDQATWMAPHEAEPIDLE